MKIRSGHCVEPGTLIRVKSAAEIAATLDDRGSLDGLPFMPEMLRFCGREFQVAARIEKTCVEGCGVRRFARNDVVTLEGLRCDGSSHDGCAVSCAIFWKEAWLKPIWKLSLYLELMASANPNLPQGRIYRK